MARFAVKEKGERSPKTVNLAGGDAFQQDPKRELVNLVLTNLLKDQYYRSTDESLNRLRELVDNVDNVFAAKAAVYARREFHMRSITHVLAAEVAVRAAGPAEPKNGNVPSWVPGFIRRVVARPDDAIEIAAYYQQQFGLMPLRLKKGLARAIEGMTEYELAKYNTGNRMVNLVNLVHPKPRRGEDDPINKLMRGTLPPAETWEVKVSQAGQKETAEEKAEAKTEAWTEMVRSGKIGHMALLRNLRNIAKDAPEVLDEALTLVSDYDKVRKGKQFPIRYLTAANEIIADLDVPTAKRIANALEIALNHSVSNVPKLEGDTVVFVDDSGSMMHHQGPGSHVSLAELAGVFAAALVKSNDADVIAFSGSAEYIPVMQGDTLLTLAQKTMRGKGEATYLASAIQAMTKRYDRIIVLSDHQTWVETAYSHYRLKNQQEALTDYERKFGVTPVIYSVDLAGYGTTSWDQSRVVQIAGFSDGIFDLMAMVEQDRDALIHEIEKVTF